MIIPILALVLSIVGFKSGIVVAGALYPIYSLSAASNCDKPNGTDTQMNLFNCDPSSFCQIRI